MEKDPTYDKIEAYLDKSLPEKERRDFEQEMTQKPELATQVDLHRFERDAMELLVEEDLRTDMNVWKKEMLQTYAANNPQNIRRLKVRRRRFLAIAASFLILVTAGTLWWLNPLTNNQQDIASNESQNNNRQPKIEQPTITPNINSEVEQPIAQLTDPQIRGSEEQEQENTQPPTIESPRIQESLVPQVQTAPQVATQNNNLELARQNFDDDYLQKQNTASNEALAALVKTYTARNYPEAAALAGKLRDPYPLGQEFLAASLFKQGQYLKAQQTYQNLMRLSISDPALRERTEWHLLLTYLALDQTNFVDFDRLLNQISGNKGHQFFDEADALKKELVN